MDTFKEENSNIIKLFISKCSEWVNDKCNNLSTLTVAYDVFNICHQAKCFMCVIFPHPMRELHHCSPILQIRKLSLKRGSVICHGHTCKMAGLESEPSSVGQSQSPQTVPYMVHENHAYPKCAIRIISFSCAHPSCNLNIKLKFPWNGTLNTTGGYAYMYFFFF